MSVYQKTKEEVLQECEASRSGLTAQQVDQRREKYGYN